MQREKNLNRHFAPAFQSVTKKFARRVRYGTRMPAAVFLMRIASNKFARLVIILNRSSVSACLPATTRKCATRDSFGTLSNAAVSLILHAIRRNARLATFGTRRCVRVCQHVPSQRVA